jgi:hypothetical protein
MKIVFFVHLRTNTTIYNAGEELDMIITTSSNFRSHLFLTFTVTLLGFID